MVHFGLVCPPGSRHLNPIVTLGHQLQHRGHRVTLINIVDAQTVADTAGIEFYPIEQAEFRLAQPHKLRRNWGNWMG